MDSSRSQPHAAKPAGLPGQRSTSHGDAEWRALISSGIEIKYGQYGYGMY